MIRNKILVSFNVDGKDVNYAWTPINFQIYNKLFVDLITEAIDQFIADNEEKLSSNNYHEVIFAHIIERDSGGAVTDEIFDPIHHEMQ